MKFHYAEPFHRNFIFIPYSASMSDTHQHIYHVSAGTNPKNRSDYPAGVINNDILQKYAGGITKTHRKDDIYALEASENIHNEISGHSYIAEKIYLPDGIINSKRELYDSGNHTIRTANDVGLGTKARGALKHCTTGKTYFLQRRTFMDQPVFSNSALCIQFVQLMKYYQSCEHRMPFSYLSHFSQTNRQMVVSDGLSGRRRVSVLAYCILPAQYFMLIRQDVQGGLCTFVARLHQSLSCYFKGMFKAETRLFEKQSVISEIACLDELHSALRYVHSLPFRHQLVDDAGENGLYPWSSYREYADVQERPKGH